MPISGDSLLLSMLSYVGNLQYYVFPGGKKYNGIAVPQGDAKVNDPIMWLFKARSLKRLEMVKWILEAETLEDERVYTEKAYPKVSNFL